MQGIDRIVTRILYQVAYVQGIDRIVSSSSDGTVCVVHPLNHSIMCFRGHERGVQAFTFCEPNKYIASGGVERVIVLWNPYTLRRITSLRGHESCIQCIEFNKRDNHIISLSVDMEVEPCTHICPLAVPSPNSFFTEQKHTLYKI